MDVNNTHVYTKTASPKEIDFTVIAAGENISPPVISIEDMKITTQRYPLSLIDIPVTKRSPYAPKIISLLNKLHGLNILHMDLSEDNIVINAEGEVRLIDFGLSKYISDITTKDIEETYCEVNFHCTTVRDLMEAEIKCAYFICGSKAPKL